MEEFNFEDIADDLEYIGNNDPYVSDIWHSLLNKLRELARLQKAGKIKIDT